MRLARADRRRRNRFCQPQNSDIGAGIASGDPGRQDGAASRDKLKSSFRGSDCSEEMTISDRHTMPVMCRPWASG